ncbi:MAG TPA: 2-amino-4-hydroxy-6-hydroxymethyldihydropteridine diphosphokinase [Vicinamibacterales bacterium]
MKKAPGAISRVAISLGSNLGDRRAHLDYAIDALHLDLSDIVVSSFVETQPVGVGPEHGMYLNAGVVGRTQLSARLLVERLLEIEEERGRVRPYPNAPRTLDADLVLYGDRIIEEDALSVPHPRFRERAFVLGPLAEIAPDMIDPVTGKTILELLNSSFRAS